MNAELASDSAQSENLQASGSQSPAGSHGEKLSYDELSRAYSEARETDRKRTLTMASATHELKTPLSIMSGYLRLLLSGKLGALSEKQTQVLTAMQGSATRLEQFAQDFLAYCTVETGKLAVSFEMADLNECLRELYRIWLVGFQNKGIAFYMPADEPLPPFRFDYHKVQRVVSTLLENALLSTAPGGTVWLAAEPHHWDRRARESGDVVIDRRRSTFERPNAVRIMVSDTGTGISPEFHQDIFEDFFTLRQQEREARGTGLGLAIARRLVRAQHGKIWVESEVGVGSKFCVVLPLRPVD
jgi:signal transduction histidine kinase